VELGDWHVESGEFKLLVGASSRDIRLEASVNVESTVDARVPDYTQTAPSYYGAYITAVPDDEFEAVYGKALPPSQRDKSQPLTILNTLEDSADGKWGGRLVRLLQKLLGTESMAGAIALQTPIKNFISMSFGLFSPAMAEGLLVILNEDKMCKGLGIIFKGIPNLIKNLGKLKQI
jgi:beta-glucosidase